MDAKGKVFYGAVVNASCINELDLWPRALLAVSTYGTIAWLETDVYYGHIRTTLKEKGYPWKNAQWIELKDDEWLIPGFIDTHIGSGFAFLTVLIKFLMHLIHSMLRSFPL